MKHQPSATYLNPNGNEVTLTWIEDNLLENYSPVFQVYGIVYNTKSEILLIEEKGKWKIPGGTPERGETAEQTLRRELNEESDATITELLPLGVQRVDYLGNPKISEGNLFYQYRYICLLDELKISTPDPDTGITNPRKFVPMQNVTDYVNWGEVGNAMFAAANALFLKVLANH